MKTAALKKIPNLDWEKKLAEASKKWADEKEKIKEYDKTGELSEVLTEYSKQIEKNWFRRLVKTFNDVLYHEIKYEVDQGYHGDTRAMSQEEYEDFLFDRIEEISDYKDPNEVLGCCLDEVFGELACSYLDEKPDSFWINLIEKKREKEKEDTHVLQ